MAVPTAYGNSWARGWIQAIAAAMPDLLTQCTRPGTEPTPWLWPEPLQSDSYLTTPQQELPVIKFYLSAHYILGTDEETGNIHSKQNWWMFPPPWSWHSSEVRQVIIRNKLVNCIGYWKVISEKTIEYGWWFVTLNRAVRINLIEKQCLSKDGEWGGEGMSHVNIWESSRERE